MTPANDNLEPIYTLAEAAGILRMTNRGVAKIAKRHGLCMVNGRNITFTAGDIERIKDVATRPQPPSLKVEARRAGVSLKFIQGAARSEMQERLEETNVYAARCDKFVKIGFARDVEKRIASLQAANPYRIDFLHAEPLRSIHYAGIAERAAHDALKGKHVRGEWFRVSAPRAIKVITFCAKATRLLAEQRDMEVTA